MSVQTYLENLATQLIARDEEKLKIQTSVSAIRTRIASCFGDNVSNHFAFGSHTRGTMLPRSADVRSDVDYMVIFKNPNNLKPQTLLNHLKTFAQTYYGRSEIKQSHPTMVLELQHINFELVPATMDMVGNLLIPSPSSSYTDWMRTSPTAFNSKLTDKNTTNKNYIKPLIRLMKYWNCKNNYHLSSFLLENDITDRSFFWATNFKDYVYTAVSALTYSWDAPQDQKDRVDRAKRVLAEVKRLEAAGYHFAAETEIKKLFPPL